MNNKNKFIADLKASRWSGAGGALFLRTSEFKFTLDTLVNTFQGNSNSKNIYVWSRKTGIKNPYGRYVPDTYSFYKALNYAYSLQEYATVIFDNSGNEIIAAMKNTDKFTINSLNVLLQAQFYSSINTRTQTIFIGCIYEVPKESAEYFQVIDVPLPDYEELKQLFIKSLDNDKNLEKFGYNFNVADDLMHGIINASLGLTRVEAQIAFNHVKYSKEITHDDVNLVAQLKSQKYSNKALEYHNNLLDLDDVGGLENLKQWLMKRKPLWTTDESLTHIPKPKGVLLTGLPGTGKSLSAKAIASAFGFPLLRLDVGSVFGKYYGESEQGMRTALKTAEANAPCVLWIDEIEKGLGASTDSGGQTREAVIGTLLTWLQERKADVFVVATANNVTTLRPEMLRKGRFDEIFFVDLPTNLERESIFKVHLSKRLPEFTGNIKELVKYSKGFSGAEIEQAIISALIEVFDAGVEATEEDIIEALLKTTPLSVSQKDMLEATRKWARDSQVVYAGIGEVKMPRVGFSIEPS